MDTAFEHRAGSLARAHHWNAVVVSEAAQPQPRPKRSRSEAKRAQDRRRRERMRANGPVEHFTQAEIAERDGWICGICQDPVDRVRQHPDPRAPSIDHIRTVASGGTHTRDNVRLTHWGCNHERSDSAELNIATAERIKALLLQRNPELQAEADKFDPEAMVRRSRQRQSPARYRFALARRIERFECEG